MEELLSAISDVYDADSDLVAAIPGGMWREKAKRTSIKPYGRYFAVSGVPSITAGSELESVVIQFDVFTDNQDSRVIWNCFAKLIVAFPTRLRIAKTVNNYVFWRIFEHARWEEGEMYHLIVQYRVEVRPN
jgi:hypothetical protein